MIFDLHSDLPADIVRRRRSGERRVLTEVHLPRFADGRVGGSVLIVGGDVETLCPLGLEHGFESAAVTLGHLRDDMAESDGRLAFARSSEELADLLDRDVFAIVVGCEGAMPIGGDPTRLDALYELGLRCLGLTWNSTNELATGLAQASDGGLTALGTEAIGWMNDLGIVIDLAHASPRTFADAVRVSTAPVLVSHANARELHDHPRNLDTNQLAAIRDLDGLVGVTAFPAFVGAPPLAVADVANHADFLATVVGVDRVGIGSDFIDFNKDAVVQSLTDVGLYESSDLDFPVGLEDVSALGNLLDELQRRGWTDDELRKVSRDNFIRLMGAVEQAAA